MDYLLAFDTGDLKEEKPDLEVRSSDLRVSVKTGKLWEIPSHIELLLSPHRCYPEQSDEFFERVYPKPRLKHTLIQYEAFPYIPPALPLASRSIGRGGTGTTGQHSLARTSDGIVSRQHQGTLTAL